MSKTLSELGDLVAPSLLRIAKGLKSLSTAKSDVLAGLAEGMASGEQAVQDLYAQANVILDDTLSIFDDGADMEGLAENGKDCTVDN